MRTTEVPHWVTFPEDDWTTITPEEAGLDREKFQRFWASIDVRGAAVGGEVHEGKDWGAVLTRGGYLVHVWGDRNYKFQTASLGKAFMRALFGLAVEEGMVERDDLISDTWSGEGQLSHPHKYLHSGAPQDAHLGPHARRQVRQQALWRLPHRGRVLLERGEQGLGGGI